MTINRWLKIMGISFTILGIIHCIATPVVFEQGFNQLSSGNGYVFIYMFLATGVSIISAGLLSIYFSHTLDEKIRKQQSEYRFICCFWELVP